MRILPISRGFLVSKNPETPEKQKLRKEHQIPRPSCAPGKYIRIGDFVNLTLRIAHKNRGLVGGSLENFNLAWKCHSFRSRLKFSIPNQRKTKGQQLKGKIVSEIFTLFHNFSHFFIIFPPGLSTIKQRVSAQWEQKRRKNKKNNGTNRCCTLVVACLSSSYQRAILKCFKIWALWVWGVLVLCTPPPHGDCKQGAPTHRCISRS